MIDPQLLMETALGPPRGLPWPSFAPRSSEIRGGGPSDEQDPRSPDVNPESGREIVSSLHALDLRGDVEHFGEYLLLKPEGDDVPRKWGRKWEDCVYEYVKFQNRIGFVVSHLLAQ